MGPLYGPRSAAPVEPRTVAVGCDSSETSLGTPVYDTRGNTTTLGNQSLTFDGATATRHGHLRHTPVSLSDVRDAADRIVSRTEGLIPTHYGHSGPGDAASHTLDAVGTKELQVPLLGGCC